MNFLSNIFSRWKPNIVILVVLSIVWVFLTYYINYDQYHLLVNTKLFASLALALIELFVFLILVKIIMASNAVLNSLDSLFQKVYFQRNFLETLSHTQRIKIAQDIQKVDSAIVFNDEIKKIDAFQSLETEWYSNPKSSKPFIILESDYVDTLYDNGQLIMYKKFHIKMMKKAHFEFKYRYIPFDKEVSRNIFDDDYYKNQPGQRWNEKSFKHKMSNNHRAKLTMKNVFQKEKHWIQFSFKTQRLIKKGDEFFIEFSIADKIELGKRKEFQERRNEFFYTEFSSLLHAIRNITFQMESYNNKNEINKKLPFEPVLFLDDEELIDIKSKKEETIYYQKWSWKIIKTTNIFKSIRFELQEL